MHRRTLSLIALMTLALIAAPAFGRGEDDLALNRKVLETERQEIVAENMKLSEEQGRTFWPLYREYMAERAKIGDRLVELVRTYAASAESMDDVKANTLLDEYFAIQQDETSLRKAWSGKFRKILPGTAVTRFFQIDNKLDALVRAMLVDEIPLVFRGKAATIAPQK